MCTERLEAIGNFQFFQISFKSINFYWKFPIPYVCKINMNKYYWNIGKDWNWKELEGPIPIAFTFH
jgi:hypothetical protein